MNKCIYFDQKTVFIWRVALYFNNKLLKSLSPLRIKILFTAMNMHSGILRHCVYYKCTEMVHSDEDCHIWFAIFEDLFSVSLSPFPYLTRFVSVITSSYADLVFVCNIHPCDYKSIGRRKVVNTNKRINDVVADLQEVTWPAVVLAQQMIQYFSSIKIVPICKLGLQRSPTIDKWSNKRVVFYFGKIFLPIIWVFFSGNIASFPIEPYQSIFGNLDIEKNSFKNLLL